MDPEVTGTPGEKMLLMLNEKVDALTDYVMSSKASIPWAPDRGHSRHGLWAIQYPENDVQYVTQQPDVEEYNRKNWKVYRLTVPSRPDLKPNYELRTAWDDRLPTRQAYVLHPMTTVSRNSSFGQGAWLAVKSELLTPRKSLAWALHGNRDTDEVVAH